MALKVLICSVISLILLSGQTLAASISESSEDSFAGDETVTRTGTCYNNKTLVEIRLPSANDSLIWVCHDESTDFTYYSKHYIFGAQLDDAEGGGNRPSFQEADFYPTIDAQNCYTQARQTETVGILLGSDSLARHYIQTQKQLFLSRGHLTPNGDPIKAVEKHATFYFINASPQWQTVNGGNWVHLETQLRAIALASRSTLTVWTGSYGIMKLNDTQGNPTEIWLGRDSAGELVRKLPVNHLTWKVIHDPATRTGVAIIQINNPWLESVSDEDVICDDVCDQLSWVNWDTTDIVNGYTYCCTVQSFREKVEYAPDLGNLPLLRSL